MKNQAKLGWLLTASLVICGLPLTAAADEGSGFEAGVRLGYGIPLGDAANDADLSNSIAGQVPLWLDLGYRIDPSWFIGIYGQYGIGSLPDAADRACIGGIDCSISDIRLGLQVHYHLSPEKSLDPWLGLGFGYEWLNTSLSGAGLEVSSSVSGFELLGLQAGLDFRVGEHFRVGPFVNLSIAQFSDVSTDCSGAAECSLLASASIADKSIHEWLMLGVRAAYGP